MNKFLSTLGLARRAGRLTYGFDMTVAGLRKICLILLAEDAAARTCKNIEETAQNAGVPVKRIPFTKEILGASIGAKPVGIIGVADRGFAGSLLKCIEGGNNFGAEIQDT